MNPIQIIKLKNPAVKRYYDELKTYDELYIGHETAIRSAFQSLLKDTAKKRGWTLITELRMKVSGQQVVPDGTLKNEFDLARGHWEAKDTSDDLDAEIRKKINKGYPTTNIIFEDSRTGILYQDGDIAFRADLTKPEQLVELLNLFYCHSEPAIEGFEKAVTEFKQRVPDLAKGLTGIISKAHTDNPPFITAFNSFFELCKSSLNPNISMAAVDEMLVQHLLTERLIRTVFNNPEFTKRNVIAQEIEKVIDALVLKSFNRQEFLKNLDRFYFAIEETARLLTEFSEKQHFLNTVYERFFQGYSVKIADTHGIVYTPQPIVDFMCASVEEVLKTEFGKTLGSKDVYIIDPCTGTGNFIVNLMRRIPKRDLPRVYREQLFANEVMLLPYYIASLNIEHTYSELTGGYESFEGLCFVDSLDMLGKPAQSEEGLPYKDYKYFTKINTERVEKQRKAPITVVIGNPPYNAGQLNENDNNKNRVYIAMDKRIEETYAKDSEATLKTQLYDMYVRFFRWASDRLGDRDGIVCFVSNNGFLRGIAFDGFRKHLASDFQTIYHFDLKGNARTSGERRRQEGGNIFSDQIRVGVGITVLVQKQSSASPQIKYFCVPDYWKAGQKAEHLRSFPNVDSVPWTQLSPDSRDSWLVPEHANEFASLVPMGNKEAKASSKETNIICRTFSSGVKTNRDEVAYDFNLEKLAERIVQFVDDYNGEVDRFKRASGKTNIDGFVRYDKIKWSGDLKVALSEGKYAEFDEVKLRDSLYRPFNKRILFFDRLLNNSVYLFPYIFPTPATESENRVICVSAIGAAKSFHCLISNVIPDIHLTGDSQCFPFYTYKEDGSGKTENITEWALKEFWNRYPGQKITKWDIFHYIYGVLHHPAYRAKYADNLKRDLPRIPYAPDFAAFREAGKSLSKWHLDYESAEPHPLEFNVNKDIPLSYRVEDKMRLSKDKTHLVVNPSLTLSGIPPEAFEYRLGNRSALEWVIDQYQVKTGKRSGILSDPNRPDDPEYIVKLVGRVIRVSLETVKIVKGLPEDFGG